MKKKITEKVIRANQNNATHSTGPTTIAGKLTSSRNAVRHGLLSRTLRFRNDKERESFRRYCGDLTIDMTPANAIERMLLEELAVCWFRLSRALRLEQQLRLKHNPATDAVLAALRGNVITIGADEPLTGERPSTWECNEFEVVVAKGDKAGEKDALSSPGKETKEHVQVKAKFSNPLETILRYRSAISRDFYRALKELQSLQETRLKRESDL